MAGTDNPYDWAPGQPPPWLSAFGPPPSLVPPVPTVAEAPPRLTPEEEAQIEIDQPPAKAQPEPTAAPVEPAPTAAPPIAQPQPAPSFLPPWLAAQQPQPQPAPAGETLPVDAVSGGAPAAQSQGESPQDTLARITLDPNAPVEQRQQAFAGLAPEERTRIVNSADPSQLATIATSAMDPAELATIMVRHQQAQLHMQTAAQLDAARKTEEEARRNWETWQRVQQEAAAKTAQLTAEANAISQEKVDPNEHGIGHFIASVLTSAVGGAMSQYTGGRNLALEELDRHTAARIEAQKADIENRWKGATFKRNLIAEHLQQSGDIYRSQETYRIAQYDRALTELQTKAQDYDQQGTTALRITSTMQQLMAQKAAAQQAFNKQQIEDGLKQAQTLQALASAAKTQQETAGLKAKQAGGGAGAAKPVKFEDQPRTLDELRGLGIAIPPNVSLPAGAPGLSLKQANTLAQAGGSAEDWAKKARENSPQEQARQLGVGELVDVNGGALKFRNPESAEKVATLKASADFGVLLLDRLISAREKYGWSSDLMKSPEWREMKADFAQFALEKKNVDQLGVLAGPDMGLIHEAAGTSDPTEVRDPTAGLRRARENVVEKLNSNIRAQVAPGVVPKRWDPPPPRPEAPTTPEQEQIKDTLNFDPRVRYQGVPVSLRKELPEQYVKRIDRLVGVAGNTGATPEAREQAAADLRNLSQNAASKLVRDYATKVLTESNMASQLSREEP